MAKGLFQVFQDAPIASTSISASGSSGISRKRSTKNVVSQDKCYGTSSGVLKNATMNGKENVDPLRSNAAPGLTGKKLNALSTRSACTSSSWNTLKIFPDEPIKKPLPKPSSNGVCTGSLRTRTIPNFNEDRPPTPETTNTINKASQRAVSVPMSRSSKPIRLHPISKSVRRTQVVEIVTFTESIENSPANSAKDSGYAPSLQASDRDEVDSADEVEMEVQDRDRSEYVDAEESNRRARALTESPLAEITEAYTGKGNFTNRFLAQPDSPSPLSTSFPISSKTPVTRKRSSPTKGAARVKPYELTSITSSSRREKRTSKNAEDELMRGVRAMRV